MGLHSWRTYTLGAEMGQAADTSSLGYSPALSLATAVLGSADWPLSASCKAGTSLALRQAQPGSQEMTPQKQPSTNRGRRLGTKASASHLSVAQVWEAFCVPPRGPGGRKSLLPRGGVDNVEGSDQVISRCASVVLGAKGNFSLGSREISL